VPRDAPDWTTWVQTTVTVEGAPVPEQAGQETAIVETEGKISDSSESYQTLASWTVTAAKVGVLRSIEIGASDYSLCQFQLTIGGVAKFTDLDLPDALTLLLADTKLAAATVVLVQGKSTTGTEVDMWGMIEGKEVS